MPGQVLKVIFNDLIKHIVDKLPGPKRVPADAKGKFRKLFELSKGEKKKVILVYFVGGITYAETSCFRYLSETTGIQFIVATTQFINGNKMVDAFKDEHGSMLKPETLTEIY